MKTRKQLLAAFANRLVDVLKAKGHLSDVAVSGVKTKVIAEKLACSIQIARRYTLGEAFPEIEQLIKLANWLDVSPGWLLFGEEKKSENQNEKLSAEILRHVLLQLGPFWSEVTCQKDLVEFVIELVYDASHLKADKKTIFKMLDIAMMSINKFQNKNKQIA